MNIRALFASSIGNIVEWYDFGLFIYCGPIFSNLVFPNNNKSLTYLYLFALFAVGFLFRPLGGILLGHIGDKIGRSKALLLSMILISIPTFLMGFLPTYSQVGIFSPVLLILIRLIQGVCIGGEYSGTMIYLAEISPKNRKAFFTSFSATGANAGFFIGIALTAIFERLLSQTEMKTFGWRVEFFLGGLFALFVIYLRHFLVETNVFLTLEKTKRISKVPFITSIKNDYLEILKIIGVVSFGATLFYITFTYLGSYLSIFNHFSLKNVTKIQTYFIASMFILVPLFSLLCDRIGRKKMYLIFCTIGITFSYFIFYFFQFGSEKSILLSIGLLTVLSSMEQATTLITVVELLPVTVRYTSLSIAYNFGNFIFGGLTPFIIDGLTNLTHNHYIPAIYLATTGLLTLLTVYFSKIK